MERPPGWSRRPAPLGSVAFSEPRFDPEKNLIFEPAHPARSVRAQPYPFGELACCFEPVDVCIAVEDEVSYLFLREQAQFLRHHGHSGWGASRDAPGVSLGTKQTDLSWRAVQDSANEISTSKFKSRRAHLGWRALNASSDGQGVTRLFSLPRRVMAASAVVHPL